MPPKNSLERTTTTTIMIFLFGTEASAAAEPVLDRDAFLDKSFFSVDDHWTHQQMLSSSRAPEATSVDLQTTRSRHRLDNDNDFYFNYV